MLSCSSRRNRPAAAAFVCNRKSQRRAALISVVRISSVQLMSCLQDPPFPLPPCSTHQGKQEAFPSIQKLCGQIISVGWGGGALRGPLGPPRCAGGGGGPSALRCSSDGSQSLGVPERSGEARAERCGGKMTQSGTTVWSGGHHGNKQWKETRRAVFYTFKQK